MISFNIHKDDKTVLCKYDEILFNAVRKLYGLQTDDVLTGCYGGGCGICKIKIISGEYKTVKKMSKAHVNELDISNGIILSCCVTPQSDMVIYRD